MVIGINASFLRKSGTGIGQVTLHFLRALIAREKHLASGHEYVLFVEEEASVELLGTLPAQFSIVCDMPFYTRDDLIRKVWWEKYSLPRQVAQHGCTHFFSLYQCPTLLPAHVEHFMLVHDMIPCVFAEQYLDNARKKYYWFLSEKAMRTATQIFSVSSHTSADIDRCVGLASTLLPISVDPIFDVVASDEDVLRVRSAYALPEHYVYIGGGLELRKNIASVIHAYKELLDARLQDVNDGHLAPFPMLVISGTLMPQLAPLITDVESLVHDLDITPYVKILGYVPQDDLPGLYRGADVFVYVSRYEGFGMPVLEAMKQGVSVLTSNSSSLPEVGGDAVAYCDAGSVDDIAQRLGDLIDNDAIRADHAQRGLQRSSAYSWDHATTLFLDQFLSNRS